MCLTPFKAYSKLIYYTRKYPTFLYPYLSQYCVVPAEVAVCHSVRQRGAAADIGLTHHRAQRAIHSLDTRPEEARPSLQRYRCLETQ